MSFVLDASVALSWCYPDEDTAGSKFALDILARTEAEVPALWPLEIANGIRSGLKRQRFTAEVAEQFLFLIRASSIFVHPPDLSVDSLFRASQRHDLTAYDAAYMELAITRGLPLATFDKQMKNAAVKADVTLLL